MSEKIAFYRKYRPQGFDHLVGQEHIRMTLLNAIKSGSLSHAYLFCGPRGTGKTTAARLLAKALNCLSPRENDEPCEKCDMCLDIAEGRLIDVSEIDAASNRGIDEIRDLKEKIQFAPTRAKNKVYIIDEVHMLTSPAFNALLKTLEEPPSHTYFILATTEVHKIPETIISRCQRFDFKRIDKKTVMTRLLYIAQKENIEIEDAAIEVIAKSCEGGMRDAIGLLEQLAFNGKLTYQHVRENLGLAGHKTIEGLFEAFISCNVQTALELIRETYREGYDLSELNREILEFLREKMLESVREEDSQKTSLIVSMIEILEDAREKLRGSIIPELALEIAAIKICKIDSREEKVESRKEEMPAPQKIETRKKEDVGIKMIPAEEAPKITSEIEKNPLTISYVKELWPRILDQFKGATLKRSAREAEIGKVEDNTLFLLFKTNFHFEKLNTTENKALIEKTLSMFFIDPVKVNLELKKLEEGAPANDVDKAMEIFGGELIED